MVWAVVALLFLQAPNHSSEGMKALDAGNYEAAAAEFRKAAEGDPQDYGAHFNLALAETMLHHDEEALAEYRKVLELKPHLYEAELNAGILLLRRNKAAEALPLLEDAAAQKPGEFQPNYSLAEARRALGNSEQAEASYKAALAINPKSAAAELGLARTLATEGKLDEAAPHYRQAAALDPKDRQYLLELADRYEKSKRPQEALSIYREFPDNPAVQAHVGEMLLNGSDYAEAIPRLEAAFRSQPTEANRLALAQAYLFNKQLDKALPLAAAAVDAEPANFELRMMYARVLRDSKQYPAAAAQFSAAARLKPGDAPAWRDLGNMLYLTGDYPNALAAFEKARALGEDTAGNCFLRAIILDKLHQVKPALEAYQRFLAMSDGKNPDQEFQARHRIVALKNDLKGH